MILTSLVRGRLAAIASLFLGLGLSAIHAEEPSASLSTGAVARLGEDRFRQDSCGGSLKWSPDGQTVVTGGWGIRAWPMKEAGKVRDLGPGWPIIITRDRRCITRLKDDSIVSRDLDSEESRVLAPPRPASKNRSYDFGWTPDRDLKRALRRDGGLTALVEISTGAPILQIDLGNPDDAFISPYGSAFSPDGKQIAAWNLEGALQILDAGDGRVLHRLEVGKECWGVELSPDGNLIAVSQHPSCEASVFEVATGRRRFSVPCGNYHRMKISLSPAWDLLAVVRPDEDRIALHRTDNGDLVRFISSEGNEISDLAFSPDGKILAAACGAFARFWDVDSGADRFPSSAHRSEVCGLSFGPDGESLASCGKDGSLRLWSTTTRSVAATFAAHQGTASDTAWAPDGSIIASAGVDGVVRFWSLHTLKETAKFSLPGTEFRHLAFKPDSALVAVGGTDGIVRLLDARTGKETGQRACRGAGQGVSAFRLAWSPDGLSLAVLSAGRGPGSSVHHEIWDPVSGAVQERGSGEPMGGELIFSPDGKTLCERYDGCVVFQARAEGRASHSSDISIRSSTNGPPHCLAYSPDGRYLAGLIVGQVHVYRVVDGGEVFMGKLDGIGSSLAWAPGGKLLATGDHMGQILLWDTAALEK